MTKVEFNYNNIVDCFVEEFPELINKNNDWDVELPYDFFGEVALYLIEYIDLNIETDSFIRKFYSFLNLMAESDKEDIISLLIVGVFEILYDSDICIKKSKELLSIKARKMFDEVKSWNEKMNNHIK